VLVFSILFVLLLVAGVPVAFVIGISSLGYLLTMPNPNILMSLPQKLYQGSDSFLLLAIPFFLMAGLLMNETGITQRLIRFLTLLMGHIRGSLAYVNVATSMAFAGITGSATADAASIGSVMIPSMKKQGYTAAFSAALSAASATIGAIIPPGIFMIMYAVFANVSVAAVFMSGVVPGVMVGITQLALIWWIGRRGTFPDPAPRARVTDIWSGFVDALLGIMMPMLIIFGLLTGVFTPTEAAVVAVAYSLLLGTFVYRTLTVAAVIRVLQRTAIISGGLLLIAANGFLFGWIMAAERIPELAASWMLSFGDSPWLFLVMVNILLLLAGAFMDELALLIILVPVLHPIAMTLGIDPVHFGIVICFNLVQGLIAPPLGIITLICAQIANERVGRVYAAMMPFLIGNLTILVLITFVPTVVLFLPRLLGL
jgi:tripartite ATP-independent transporter DctM subunit